MRQTYPEEERPCLSKYWKIYFPDREISLALFLDYLLNIFNPFSYIFFLQLKCSAIGLPQGAKFRRICNMTRDVHTSLDQLKVRFYSRKTVAIQTRSVIGERNNTLLVGNNRFPTENNGSYCTRRPMKIEVWKRCCTILLLRYRCITNY